MITDKAPQQASGWHFNREIQITHLISTVMIALSAVVYTQKLEQRIAIMESQNATQRDRDDRQDTSNKELMNHLRNHLDRMEIKIDRLIDYKSGK